MISFRIGRTRVECTAFFFAMLAFALAYQDGGRIVLWLACMLVHELGHLMAMAVQGIGVRRVVFGFGRITIEPLSEGDMLQQMLVLLMGPLVNLTLSAACFKLGFKQAAYINIALALINLVPAGTLDGGRLFHGAALLVLGAETAAMLSGLMSVLFGGALVCAGLYQLSVLRCGPSLLVFGGFVLLSAFQNLRYTKPR